MIIIDAIAYPGSVSLPENKEIKGYDIELAPRVHHRQPSCSVLAQANLEIGHL